MERGIQQLKKRFHVLHSEIRLDPVKTCKDILDCASLHYLCKQKNLHIPPFPEEDNINLGIDTNLNLPGNSASWSLLQR